MASEFLPLCDVLFNIISLASYFCDVVFDCVTVYTLYEQDRRYWFYASLSCILGSLLLCQVCSLAWHLDSDREGRRTTRPWLLAVQHMLLGGVLARYFMLFVPVDLRNVKHEVRDLCVLRMLHAFCQAGPMLLLQLFLIWQNESAAQMTDLNVVSTALSLFSVCWALASFNKNVRSHNVHRLVLTWLGVICQLAWRLGTVTSRCLALTVYATVYGYWVLLVIFLHWVSMFLWLISPKNVFHGEKMPVMKKIGLSMLLSFSYIFCYINLEDVNSRRKMVTFYLTMLLENTLLVSVWIGGLRTTPWYQYHVTITVFVSFGIGILFLLLYYKFFHVRKLQQNFQSNASTAVYACAGCPLGKCKDKTHRMPFPYFLNELSASDNSTIASDARTTTKVNNTTYHRPFGSRSKTQYITGDSLNVPGVFNCRFNPAIKRKKKKPTSFVPPPAPILSSMVVPNNVLVNNGRVTPFWKRPPPHPVSSDHEGSVGSRVNIQQKIQEKKNQQLAELHQIEEEIRSGKLKRPLPSDISDTGTLPQPIPKAKKQPWVTADESSCPYIEDLSPNNAIPSLRRKNRSQTPEILLSPHYLENSRIYYEYQDPRWKYGNNYLPSDEMSNSSRSKPSTPRRNCKTPDKPLDLRDREKVLYKSVRAPSDLDSQISLPRSYTLPREFKFYRRPKARKIIRDDQFLTSTNSSDGDVDSCEDVDQLLPSDENYHSPVAYSIQQRQGNSTPLHHQQQRQSCSTPLHHQQDRQSNSTPLHHQQRQTNGTPLHHQRQSNTTPLHHQQQRQNSETPLHHQQDRQSNTTPLHHQQDRQSNNNTPLHHQQDRQSNSTPLHHQQDRQSNNNTPLHHQQDRQSNSTPLHHQQDRQSNNNTPLHHQQDRQSNNTPLHHQQDRQSNSTPLHHQQDRQSNNNTPLHHQQRQSNNNTPLHHQRQGNTTPLHHLQQRQGNSTPLHNQRQENTTPLHHLRQSSGTPEHAQQQHKRRPRTPSSRGPRHPPSETEATPRPAKLRSPTTFSDTHETKL